MDARSEACLVQVHPDLVAIVREAARHSAFIVIHGLRTLAEEAVNVAHHASQTMHSRHLPNADGFACAVDVACLADGHVTWEPKAYVTMWGAVETAGAALRIPVEWGGSWTTLKDFGHLQLPWKVYP